MLTGKSGSGKTSLLSKIRGIKENGVWGEGNIYYPAVEGRDPKIIMLSQQDYFPINYSLEELLFYPGEIPTDPGVRKEKQEQVVFMLREMGIDVTLSNGGKDDDIKEKNTEDQDYYLSLGRVENWCTFLCGGEKKKILIASAIIQEPDILILDEVFNGLDARSIIVAQKILKKYLPHALLLVVDHHAQDNNHDVFYDKELHFSNQEVFQKDLE